MKLDCLTGCLWFTNYIMSLTARTLSFIILREMDAIYYEGNNEEYGDGEGEESHTSWIG